MKKGFVNEIVLSVIAVSIIVVGFLAVREINNSTVTIEQAIENRGVKFGAPISNVFRNLFPEANITYDLGSSTRQWRTGYIHNASTTLLSLGVIAGCLEADSTGLATSTGSACGSGTGSGFSTTSADYWVQGTKSPFTVASIQSTSTATSTFAGGIRVTGGVAASTFLESGLVVASSTFTLGSTDYTVLDGNGLTISGTTLAVGAGTCITANANDVAVTTNCTDATTLDSIDSGSFLRSDASDNYTSGTLTFDSGTVLSVAGSLFVTAAGTSTTAQNTRFATTSVNFLETGFFRATSTATSTITGGLTARTINTVSATSTLTGLVIGSSGLQVGGLDCTGLANSGKLTTDSAGNVICGGDISGAGSSIGGSKWATSSDDTTAIYPNSALKVGIGSTSPWTMLGVSGSASFGSTTVSTLVSTSTTATSSFAGPLSITGTANQYMLGLIASGDIGDSAANVQNGALIVDNTNNTYTPGLYVSSGQAGVPSNPLAIFRSTSGSYNQGLLWLLGDSTNTGGAAFGLRVQDANPDIEFVESDQTAPVGRFEIDGNNDLLRFNGRNPANDSFDVIMHLQRPADGGRLCLTEPEGFSDCDSATGRLGIVGTSTFPYLTVSSSTAATHIGNILTILRTPSRNGFTGIGTTSPYARLGVSGEIVAANFTGTTTASSTFAGGVSATRLHASTASSTLNGISLSGGCFNDGSGCVNHRRFERTMNISNATTTDDLLRFQIYVDSAMTIDKIVSTYTCSNSCTSAMQYDLMHGTNLNSGTALTTQDLVTTSSTTMQSSCESGCDRTINWNDNTLAAGEAIWFDPNAASTTQITNFMITIIGKYQ